MRFYTNEEELVVVSKLAGLQCNGCGNIFNPDHEDMTQRFDDLRFSYRSKYSNQKPFSFELCESCLLKIVRGFEIVPENFMSDASQISTCDNDHELHQKTFDKWKVTNEWEYDNENYWEDYFESKADDSEGNNETATIYPFVNYKPEVTD